MSASPSKWEAEKWAGEWALCTFTISKSFSHVTEVTQMSLFHSFPIFTHLRFLAYQVTNCIWEGRKGCIRSFFWQPSSVPRGKKKKHTTPTPPHPHPPRSVCCSELFLQIREGCDVEGRVASSPRSGLLGDIWDGGWAVSWKEKIQVAYLQMNLRGSLGRSWTVAVCFPKPSPCCDRCSTATFGGQALHLAWSEQPRQ